MSIEAELLSEAEKRGQQVRIPVWQALRQIDKSSDSKFLEPKFPEFFHVGQWKMPREKLCNICEKYARTNVPKILRFHRIIDKLALDTPCESNLRAFKAKLS